MPHRVSWSLSIQSTVAVLAVGVICLFLPRCGGKSAAVEKTVENGVEVVLNRQEPYAVHGEPSHLLLEREYAIDAERREIAEQGLADIRDMGIDSLGNVYLVQPSKSAEFLVFKFDNGGRFLRKFVRRGSGPGEVQLWNFFDITPRDEVRILESGTGRLITFGPSGDLVNEVSLRAAAGRDAMPLANGNYIGSEPPAEEQAAEADILLSVYDSRFVKIRNFSRYRFPLNFALVPRINVFIPAPITALTRDRIFIGYPGENYEIGAFDLEGKPVRKIRKAYRPVPLTENYKNGLLSKVPKGSPLVQKLYFPANKPAFQFMFADENGHLFVATSETDPQTGQDICDIFNRDGVFIGRAPIGYFDYVRSVFEPGASLRVAAGNGRILVLHEKESGFKELIVYKATWS